MIEEIIVIGNGLAGLSAAIYAAMNGAHVSIVSLSTADRSQSVLAAGGMNSALNNKGQDDAPEEHCRDTLKAGCYLADEAAVRNLTQRAPEVVEWLASIGVVFNRTEDHKIDQRYFGGQKKMRTVYSQSAIGRQLIAGLSLQLRKYIAQGNIKEYIDYEFVRLRCSGTWDAQKVEGCVISNRNDGTCISLDGKAVIIASGGFGGFFGKTTGTVQNTGDVTATLFSQGVWMGNLEMIQFHPTTVETDMKKLLMSEASRGEGGRLFVYREQEKWYFMEELYPEMGNLMPRDVVSFEEYKQSRLEGLGQVYLDLTHLPEATLHGKLKEVTDLCETYLGIDPQKEYIPVSPGIHYFMGGIWTDARHRTNIEGLFAAGECACIYHGANRLGGNSTIGAIVGGIIAGEEAANREATNREAANQRATNGQSQTPERDTCEEMLRTDNTVLERIANILNRSLPIVRSEEVMEQGLKEIEALEKESCPESYERMMITFAKAVIMSGLWRKESRGAHIRTDYPDLDEHYRKVTVAAMKEDGELEIRFENPEICFE